MSIPSQEYIQNTVPGASPASQGTVNPAEILSNIFTKNQGELEKAAIRANTSIPGGHATSIPATMTTPRQFSPGQLDRREVVGAGNARAQGIGNSVIAVMNAIAGTETAIDNKKKLEVASATQQLITAQQAYDQAAQLYQQNPQNADAKAAMERNKSVMNGILANDKVRKAIAKGMNVDFTDPKANDTIEHKGVAEGKQMAREHIDYAEQFNKQTPQMMAPNQQAIAAYQAKLQEQKLNVESMRAMIPLINAQMRQQDVQMQIQGRMDQEQFKQQAANARAFVESQDKWDRLNASIQARAQQMKTQFGYKLAEIAAEGTKEFEVFKVKMQSKQADPATQAKAYNDFQTKAAATISNMEQHISTMEINRTKEAEQLKYSWSGKPKTDDSMIKNLDADIQGAKEALQQYQKHVKDTQDYYNAFGLKGGADGGAGSGSSGNVESGTSRSTSKTLGSASTYLAAPSGDEIEDSSDDPDLF